MQISSRTTETFIFFVVSKLHKASLLLFPIVTTKNMEESVFFDEIFSGEVNVIDSPWSVDNSLFEDVLTCDLNNGITDLFNDEEKDEDFEDEDAPVAEAQNSITQISDEEIKNLGVRELNKLLRDMQPEEAAIIRRRRRNLKNRDYALICRQRRLQLHEDLINENKLLKRQLEDDREKLRKVVLERNTYKRKLLQLQSVCRKQFVLGLVSPM